MTPPFLPLLLGAGLLLVARPGDEPKAPPSAAEVARVTDDLDQAFRSADVKQIQAALLAAAAVPDASIVRRVVRALDDERTEVALGALQSLRWQEHPDALQALHAASKERKRMKSPEVAAAVLRAIAQHAEPSSISVLAREPFEPQDHACLRARLFGLARIRTPEALEALLGVLALTGPGGRERRILPQMDDARLSLMMLTGVDQGASPENWERWWRANKKTFRIPDQAPLLPKDLREIWDQFFGLPRDYERQRPRADRGQEPGKTGAQ